MRTPTQLTIADVGIQLSFEEKLLQRFALPNKNDHNFVPGFALQTGQISIHINSFTTPTHAGEKIISSEDRLWQMYHCEEGYLDCRFYAENPMEPTWWSYIDHYFGKIDIGLNLDFLRPASGCHSLPGGLGNFATDRKLMIPALLNFDVLLFHGAGGMVQNRGFVIAGPSGSGKSTMAGLLVKAGHPMFSDECMALRNQNDNTWQAYGTPWDSSAGIARNESVPLAAILFLQQAQITSLQRLSRGESLKRTLQFCTIPWYLPAFADKALSVCEQLIDEIPMYELNCSLEDQPIKAIERLAESL